MRYIKALKRAPSEFKRMYGVTVERFWEMVKAVRDGKLGSRGSHASLPILDQILLTLQYWREYRTYFHIAQDWGMHESTAQGTVKRIEDIRTYARTLYIAYPLPRLTRAIHDATPR